MFGCILENALENPFLSYFSHFLSFQTNISSNPIKPKFSIPNKKNSSNQRSKRASRSATRSTISGFDDRWRFLGSTIGDDFSVRDLRNGFDDAISLSLSLSLSVFARLSPSFSRSLSLSLSLGIARRTSLVLGFLGLSELLDVDRSCLRRCWGVGAISFPGAEVIWSENENGNYFLPSQPYFTVKLKSFSVWPNFQ